MKTGRPSSAPPKALRTRAEHLLATTRREVAHMPVADVQKLVHELQVHQVELEMQNDELRRAQQELETARDRYADLYDFAPCAHLTLNADGEILEANLNAGQLLGLERGGLIHQKLTRFIAAETKDAFHLFCRQVFSTEGRRITELGLVTAQGRRLLVHVEAVSDPASGRKQGRFSFIDITEHKQVEQSLRESEQFAQCVVDSLAANIAIVDQKGRIVAVNQHWRDFAARNGTNPAAVSEGANYLAACGAGAKKDAAIATISAGLNDMLAGRRHEFHHEYACHSPTKQRWFLMRVTPFPSDGLRRVVVAHEDITERKLAEVALRASEAQLHSFVQEAPAAIAMFDQNMNYLAASQRWMNDFGCGHRELVGRNHYEVTPDLPERWKEIHRKSQAGETHASDEDLWVKADGRRAWFRWVVRPWQNVHGNIGGIMMMAEDISARKNTEEALHESEARHRALFESSRDAIMTLEPPAWRFSTGNPATVKMFRTGDVNRFVTAAPWELSPEFQPDGRPSRKAAKKMIETALRQGSHFFEWRHRRLDGEEFPASVLLTRVELAGRAFLQATVRDITREKRAEEELRRNEERYRTLIEQAPDGLFVIRADDSQVLDVNSAACRMFGYTREEALGRSVVDLVAPEDAARIAKAIARLRTKETVFTEWQARRKDGSLFPAEVRAQIIPGGRIQGFVRDLTERKRVEDALHEASQFNQQIIAGAKEGIIVYDRDLKYVVWNLFMEELTGVPAAEVIGKRPLGVFPFLRSVGVMEQLGRVLAGKECAAKEFHFHAPQSGRSGWVSDTNSPLRNAQGEITGVIGVVRDITERKRADQLLQNINRTLQAIRDCHEAMLRAKTERVLLEDICRIIVQTGGERMVWVAFAEKNAGKSVRVGASAGVSRDYLAKARITWADEPRGRGPVGTAIRTGQVCLCQNTLKDLNFAPWRAGARRNGYGSVIALPLMVEGQCIGALCIYAAEPDAFDTGEQLLFTDLANDLAFGISTLRLRADRERLEDELLSSVEREQQRIGRDLHDGLCQMLVATKYRSSYLKQIVKGSHPDAEREAQVVEKLLNQAIQQARDLARGLNPVHVTPAELPAALQKLADNVMLARGPQCFCQFVEPAKLADGHAAYHLYRIAQEAVQNVLMHARARSISITLAQQNQNLVLAVKDDGAGIPLRFKKTGMGLNNMQTRARLIGARLEIRRRAAGGTVVTCELPQATGKPA